MAEMRYAGADDAAGHWGKLVWGSRWTLKNWYSWFQLHLLNGRIAGLL